MCIRDSRGSAPITTWDGFKRELKRQFYPEDAANEARAKLRHLQHNEGPIREYIKEFQDLLLEIPSMGRKMYSFTSLMAYVDGPRWSSRGVVYETSSA